MTVGLLAAQRGSAAHRGQHTRVARKQGYEDLTADIWFQSRTDVLHMRITAFTQLLDTAQAALGELRWADSEIYLTRGEQFDAADPVLRYLLAIHAYKTGD